MPIHTVIHPGPARVTWLHRRVRSGHEASLHRCARCRVARCVFVNKNYLGKGRTSRPPVASPLREGRFPASRVPYRSACRLPTYREV